MGRGGGSEGGEDVSGGAGEGTVGVVGAGEHFTLFSGRCTLHTGPCALVNGVPTSLFHFARHAPAPSRSPAPRPPGFARCPPTPGCDDSNHFLILIGGSIPADDPFSRD